MESASDHFCHLIGVKPFVLQPLSYDWGQEQRPVSSQHSCGCLSGGSVYGSHFSHHVKSCTPETICSKWQLLYSAYKLTNKTSYSYISGSIYTFFLLNSQSISIVGPKQNHLFLFFPFSHNGWLKFFRLSSLWTNTQKMQSSHIQTT